MELGQYRRFRNDSEKLGTLTYRNKSQQIVVAGLMTGLGHVWTAPWQELSDVAAALVGCGHVSGLLMRRMCRWP